MMEDDTSSGVADMLSRAQGHDIEAIHTSGRARQPNHTALPETFFIMKNCIDWIINESGKVPGSVVFL